MFFPILQLNFLVKAACCYVELQMLWHLSRLLMWMKWKLVLFYMWLKLKQNWAMQFTCLVFLFLTVSLNISLNNLLRMKFESQNASSPIMLLIGKLVGVLIISQVLLKMPDFVQAVKWWDHHHHEELLPWRRTGKTLISGFAWFPAVKHMAFPSPGELGLKCRLVVDW